MQKPPSKAQIRQELENDLADFIESGKTVEQIPKGVSGKEIGENYTKKAHWQMEKSDGERTYLPDVLKALDERKKPKLPPKKSARRRPRKKLIYDDFGEVLRWVWVDE